MRGCTTLTTKLFKFSENLHVTINEDSQVSSATFAYIVFDDNRRR
jgi:hypothetical protein